MYLTWQARLQQTPALWDFTHWPSIDTLSLPPAKRWQYLRNQHILSRVLDHVPLNEIEAEYHFARGRLTHFMNRCLGGDSEEEPPLTKALIPGFRVTSGQRRAPLASLAAPAGSSYAFLHLLETAPGLQDYLEKLLKKFSTRTRKSQNLRINTFHKAVIRYLRQIHWPSDRYPFTAENLGYHGVYTYFHRRWAELQLPAPPTRRILPSMRPLGIFEELEIDEHTVDAQAGVLLELDKRWEPLRVSRMSLIVCRDVASNTVIARQLVLSRYVCRNDMLMLFTQLSTVWQSRALCSPGLVWPAEPYMPSQIGEAFLRPTLGVIRLDNALVHLAHDVRDHICTVLGATLNLGLPRYPTARVLIESAFKDLNLTVHRLPSTTGSHPMDPLKEPRHHRKHVPVVSLKTLEEMIDVHIATMNTHIMGNIGAQSPIQVMRTQMAHHLIPLRPSCVLGQENPLVLRERVKVYAEKGTRREPWINFLYLRYSKPGVLPAELIGTYITIEYRIDAISRVRAFRLEGDFLGELLAPKAWLRFEHSVVTRKYIMNLVNTGKLRASDPFGGYYDHLLDHRDAPSIALEIVRFARELHQTPVDGLPPEPPPLKKPDNPGPDRQPPTIPGWKTLLRATRGLPDGH